MSTNENNVSMSSEQRGIPSTSTGGIRKRSADADARAGNDDGAAGVCRGGVSLPLRLYAYGLHGFWVEVMFTAVWEFVVSRDAKLPGYTSVWSFLVYAVCVYGIELLYVHLLSRRRGAVWWVRGCVYLAWGYSWEAATGRLLGEFGARPWDYSSLPLNVGGVITFEYAPLWFAAGLATERLVVRTMLRLQWCSSSSSSPPPRGGNNDGKVDDDKKVDDGSRRRKDE